MNDGHCKKIGGSQFIEAIINDKRCVIKVDGDLVYIDDKAMFRDDDVTSDSSDLNVAISKIQHDSLGQEKWILTNISKNVVTTGLPNHSVLGPGKSIDALSISTKEEINNNNCIQNAKKRGLLSLQIVHK